MRLDKNHEGYHDPTAGAAIRKAERSHRDAPNWEHLTYQKREVKGFMEVRARLRSV